MLTIAVHQMPFKPRNGDVSRSSLARWLVVHLYELLVSKRNCASLRSGESGNLSDDSTLQEILGAAAHCTIKFLIAYRSGSYAYARTHGSNWRRTVAAARWRFTQRHHRAGAPFGSMQYSMSMMRMQELKVRST